MKVQEIISDAKAGDKKSIGILAGVAATAVLAAVKTFRR